MAILTVKLNKVTNLKDGDLIGKSDPYVKFELEQDNMVFDKDFGKQKSSVKSDDCNPVYDETFTFEVPSTEGLHNLVLTCKIMDDDTLKDDKLGKCKIKLDDLSLSETPTGVDRVVDKNIFSSSARIYLEISYVP